LKAVLIISHGSRIVETKEEIRRLIVQLRHLTEIPLLEYAFLEIESPSIPEGIADCVRKGATEIILLLNFLNAGHHVDKDIPRIIAGSQILFPSVKIHITAPLGQHSAIPRLFAEILLPFTPAT